MADEQLQHPSPWDQQRDLPAEAIDALRRPVGQVVAIVATVDADGAPRTAAFGSVRPITPRTLRFGCNRAHDTFANVVRDGRVMVAVFAPPDAAVGIRGQARVVAEQMRALPGDAVIQIDVEAVKNDFLPAAAIVTGITYTVTGEVARQLDRYLAEVEAAEPKRSPS